MEKRTPRISYLAIPGEICLICQINTSIEDIKPFLDNNIISCIAIENNDATSNEVLKLLESLNTSSLKTAWFNNRHTLPWKAEQFNYIKLNDIIYMNISEGKSIRFSEIPNKVELDPLDPFYYDILDELKLNDTI